MQLKISKTLEGIIARAAFNTTKAGMTHSLKDILTLELLREEGSLAYQLLSSRLKDWELYQIRLRIEREVISAKQQEPRSLEEYYRNFTEELLAMPGVARSVSTAHALLAIISDRSTATARVLEMYGVTADSVSGDLQKFAVGDDFRTEVQVHMLDFGEENRNEEKGPAHLLDKLGVKHEERKLDYGDYSFTADGRDFSMSCVVERKANVDEIYNNVTSDRGRIEKELYSAAQLAKQLTLFIEGVGSWEALRAYHVPEWQMKASPQRVKTDIGAMVYSTLKAWQTGSRYHFDVQFIEDKRQTAARMLEVFYYYWRSYKEMTAARKE